MPKCLSSFSKWYTSSSRLEKYISIQDSHIWWSFNLVLYHGVLETLSCLRFRTLSPLNRSKCKLNRSTKEVSSADFARSCAMSSSIQINQCVALVNVPMLLRVFRMIWHRPKARKFTWRLFSFFRSLLHFLMPRSLNVAKPCSATWPTLHSSCRAKE